MSHNLRHGYSNTSWLAECITDERTLLAERTILAPIAREYRLDRIACNRHDAPGAIGGIKVCLDTLFIERLHLMDITIENRLQSFWHIVNVDVPEV